MLLFSAMINGKSIAYSSETEFIVQVGKGAKGCYKTQAIFKGNLTQAVIHYNMISVGNGYKKRLLMPNVARNPVLARQIS